jgi:hypothetical protein
LPGLGEETSYGLVEELTLRGVGVWIFDGS